MIQYFKKGRRKWVALGLTFVIAFITVSWEMLRKEKAKARENETSSEYYDESALMKMFGTEDFNEKEMVELKDERTTNSTTYDMGNGFKKVVYYSSDVRFKDDDGKLSDYDSSLKQSKVTREGNSYKYESSVGDIIVYLLDCCDAKLDWKLDFSKLKFKLCW